MSREFTQECDSFRQFYMEYPEVSVSDLLSGIEDCIGRRSREDIPSNILYMHVETLDREGGNHKLTGEIVVENRIYWFVIESGNWNGTVVKEWEDQGLTPLYKLYEIIKEYNTL
jgi:hypothetical protein